MWWRSERQRTARRRVAPLAFGAVAALAAALLAVPGFAGSQLAFAGLSPGREYALRFVLPPTRIAEAGRRAAVDPAEPSPAPSVAAVLTGTDDPPVTAAPKDVVAVATKLPVPTRRRLAARAKLPGVMALSFTIGARPDDGDAIEVEKPVWVAGTEAGRLAVRIDATSRLYAQGREVAALLEQAGGAKAPRLDDAYVSFNQLRELGIGVRYDAVHDRIELSPPAA